MYTTDRQTDRQTDRKTVDIALSTALSTTIILLLECYIKTVILIVNSTIFSYFSYSFELLSDSCEQYDDYNDRPTDHVISVEYSIYFIIIIIIIYFAQANKLTVKIKLHEQVRQGWG